MLILTRRIGEKIIISDHIIISVIGIDNNEVRLGIDAPKEVSVHRKEVYDKLQNIKYGKQRKMWEDKGKKDANNA